MTTRKEALVLAMKWLKDKNRRRTDEEVNAYIQGLQDAGLNPFSIGDIEVAFDQDRFYQPITD